jgi:hypothetical protein
MPRRPLTLGHTAFLEYWQYLQSEVSAQRVRVWDADFDRIVPKRTNAEYAKWHERFAMSCAETSSVPD